MEPIVNRVAESDIVVYNLEELWDGREVVEFDLAPLLFEGLILREKDFRAAVKAHDWAPYEGKHVAVYCSTDAIVPTWASMLVASKLTGRAASVAAGRTADLLRDHFTRALAAEDWSRFRDRPVVIKGCGSRVVPPNAYLLATEKLQGVAKKLMYGEPCSSVPLWRRPRPKAEGQPAKAARPAAVRPVGLPKSE
ncbi:MAG: DUF2480 family protein [Rhodothermales bacterium]|nr:DUF2480 family protein [Rhodothermales bacterium]